MAEPETKTDTTQAKAPAAAPVAKPAPPLAEGTHYIWGTGRRKSAVARVRIRPGSGEIVINNKTVDEYFPAEKDRNAVGEPLKAANMVGSWDVFVNVSGGGPTGQAGAVELGLARALAKSDEQVELALRKRGLLTRDPRMSERKKYGQPGARKRFQFSKR